MGIESGEYETAIGRLVSLDVELDDRPSLLGMVVPIPDADSQAGMDLGELARTAPAVGDLALIEACPEFAPVNEVGASEPSALMRRVRP